MDEAATSLVNMEETIFEKIIRVGLMIGAIFQIACLWACIFIPFSGNCGNGSIHCLHDRDRKDIEEGSEALTATLNVPKRNHHRNRKQEKKKRR